MCFTNKLEGVSSTAMNEAIDVEHARVKITRNAGRHAVTVAYGDLVVHWRTVFFHSCTSSLDLNASFSRAHSTTLLPGLLQAQTQHRWCSPHPCCAERL